MKRTRVKRQSKKNPLVRECDNLVRAIVFDRDGYQCVRCGSQKVLDPAHIHCKNRYQNIRFLEINILTGCRECHIYWHNHPKEFRIFVMWMYPERWDALLLLKEQMPSPDLKDLRLELLARQPEIASLPVKRMGWTDSELPF
jgi:hypothetical protein